MQLKQWIEENGIKQSFIANRLGVSRSYVTKLKQGICSPSPEIIVAIHEFTDGEVTVVDWASQARSARSAPAQTEAAE